MLEQYAFFVLVAGLVVGVAGWLWLVVAAFKVSKPWGFGVLLLPPLAIVFVPTHLRKSVAPLVVFLVSGALLGAPRGQLLQRTIQQPGASREIRQRGIAHHLDRLGRPTIHSLRRMRYHRPPDGQPQCDRRDPELSPGDGLGSRIGPQRHARDRRGAGRRGRVTAGAGLAAGPHADHRCGVSEVPGGKNL